MANVEIAGIGLLVANILGVHSAADFHHTIDKFFEHTADDHILARCVIAGHKGADHAGSAHAADAAMSFKYEGLRAVSSGCHSRTDTGRTGTYDDNINTAVNRQFLLKHNRHFKFLQSL